MTTKKPQPKNSHTREPWWFGNWPDSDMIESESGPVLTSDGDISKADEALIEAAPDLLAALQNWFECADGHEVLCRCGRDSATEAIAKAKGQSK